MGAIKNGKIGRLVIGELDVHRLHVHELIVDAQQTLSEEGTR